MGAAGTFSFYPSKNLGAAGDAGMIICHDKSFAERLRHCRQHGMEPRYYHHFIGGNFRLDEIQAAILQVKLPHLDEWSAARRRAADIYREEFTRLDLTDSIALPVEPFRDPGLTNHHIYHQYVIRTPQRDALREHLTRREIGTAIYYPLALHEQECFRYLGYRAGDFPESERAARETLALPMYPEFSPEASTLRRGIASPNSQVNRARRHSIPNGGTADDYHRASERAIPLRRARGPHPNHLRRKAPKPISTLAVAGNAGRYRSGQTGRTVNPLAYAFTGSNPVLPSPTRYRFFFEAVLLLPLADFPPLALAERDFAEAARFLLPALAAVRFLSRAPRSPSICRALKSADFFAGRFAAVLALDLALLAELDEVFLLAPFGSRRLRFRRDCLHRLLHRLFGTGPLPSSGMPAARPARAPITPPTTAPTGPATLPRTAPVAAPAACFEMGGI